MAKRKRKLPILKIEGTVLVVASLAAYSQFNLSYLWVLVAVFVPDLFFPERFRNNRKVELIYDLLHTYPLPAIAMFISVVTDFKFEHTSTAYVFLWFTHIGFDRLIGRGAKYDGVFVDRQLALARQLLGEPARQGDEEFIATPPNKLPSKWGD
jgi:hypothetical protein